MVTIRANGGIGVLAADDGAAADGRNEPEPRVLNPGARPPVVGHVHTVHREVAGIGRQLL
jgi:hypothetical protein